MSNESDRQAVLPKGGPELARGAFLSAVAMGRMALLQGLSGFEHGRNPKARLFAELEAERARSALLVEELRIKDARFARIPAQKRPHYPPADRLAIFTARATAGWNLTETARRLQVTPKTITSWLVDHFTRSIRPSPLTSSRRIVVASMSE